MNTPRLLSRIFAVGLLATGLAACADEPEVASAPQSLGASGYQIQAAQLEVLDSYEAPGRSPYLDHTLATKPEDLLVSWAKRRFRPMGTAGIMRVVIMDASVTSRDLLGPDAGSSWFRDRAAEEFNARAEIRMEYLHPDGTKKDWATAIATARRTINESADAEERQAAIQGTVRDLVRNLDREALAAAKKYMPRAY